MSYHRTHERPAADPLESVDVAGRRLGHDGRAEVGRVAFAPITGVAQGPADGLLVEALRIGTVAEALLERVGDPESR